MNIKRALINLLYMYLGRWQTQALSLPLPLLCLLRCSPLQCIKEDSFSMNDKRIVLMSPGASQLARTSGAELTRPLDHRLEK